jgi:UDP-2,3-diacylglucosamine pyrophosphatase LpxH
MAEGKTLFISDIHLGAGKEWDWFNRKEEGPYLINFFKYVAERQKRDGDIKDLVLLGDIFDLWVCPYDEVPHTFSDVRAAQQEIFHEIKKTAETVNTLYVNGNHDFRVKKEDIAEAFDGRVTHIGNHYRRRNIHAEHGHRFALFNRPDPKNGGPQSLPLGYYISRLDASIRHNRKGKFHLKLQAIDELFQMMGPEKLPQSVFDALRDAVSKTLEVKVDEFTMGPNGEGKLCKEIREEYKNLFEDWQQSKGYWFAAQMIMSEMNRLGTLADKLCRDGVNIVIFGHSHDTKMDKDSWFTEDRIYANCGYWCGFNEPGKVDDNAHFVETDGRNVALYKFNNGDVKLAKEKAL